MGIGLHFGLRKVAEEEMISTMIKRTVSCANLPAGNRLCGMRDCRSATSSSILNFRTSGSAGVETSAATSEQGFT
jgi:hypothetical protein